MYEFGKFYDMPVDLITVAQGGLRPAEVKSPQFQGLMRSIQKEGVNQNITVRPSDDDSGKFLLVDGLQRLTASKMLGLETVPVRVGNLNDARTMSVQIQMNIHRVDTRPAAYGRQLLRMIALDPANNTVPSLAEELGMSTAWIEQRLSLTKLDGDAAEMVDSGEITASNAVQLARLPIEEQVNYLEDAKNSPTPDFADKVKKRLAEIKEATNAGKTAGPPVFEPNRKVRGKTEVSTELDTCSFALSNGVADMEPLAAYKLALEYALCVDPISVAAAREVWDAEQAKRAAEKADREEKARSKRAAKLAAEEAGVVAPTVDEEATA